MAFQQENANANEHGVARASNMPSIRTIPHAIVRRHLFSVLPKRNFSEPFRVADWQRGLSCPSPVRTLKRRRAHCGKEARAPPSVSLAHAPLGPAGGFRQRAQAESSGTRSSLLICMNYSYMQVSSEPLHFSRQASQPFLFPSSASPCRCVTSKRTRISEGCRGGGHGRASRAAVVCVG